VRQGQQNRRGRGRNNNNNNNNRKGQNPLSRSFESNGPDVKIRGTPAHIAEKYLTLARDAQSSGDPVLAENYLQHAEHYSRIIMAYREQLQQHGEMPNGSNGQRLRGPNDPGEGEDFGGDDDEGGDDMLDDGFAQPPMPQHQPHQQQNRQSGYDANRDRPFRREQGGGGGGNRFRDRDRNQDRNDRPDRSDHRNDRPDRDRPDRDRAGEGRPSAPPQHDAPAAEGGGGGGEPRRRERFQPTHEQPEFLRRPVRRTRSEGSEPPPPAKDEPQD
jgi:hypothetical protein